MPVAYGYLRVSTPGQKASGLGLEAQMAAITAYYEYALKPQGYTLGPWCEDAAITGKRELFRRPAGQRLSLLVEPGDTVIFAKLDRGFRNLKDLLNTHDIWQAKNVRIVLLDLNVDTWTPAGRMNMQIIAAVAEFERSRIGERCREAIAARRAANRAISLYAPYGFIHYTDHHGDRRVKPCPYERSVGLLVVRWKLAGYSYEVIWRHLKDRNILNKYNRRFPRGHISAMFHAECLLLKHEGQDLPAPIRPEEDHPPKRGTYRN